MSKAFAIIGCQHAHISMFIAEMTALGYECAGIYDPEPGHVAAGLAQKYKVPLVDRAEQLLGPSIAVVGSSAANHEKIGIIELCEQHGKPVMIDKPAVVDRPGLERLEAVVSRGSIPVGMLLTERFRPATAALKRMIDAGELGKLVSITMRKPHRLHPSTRPPWHFVKSQNGGIVIDLFIHDIDLLRWLSGQEVSAARTTTVMIKNILPEHPDFYDAAAAQLVLDDGLIAQLYSDWHTPNKSWTWGDCRIFVAGTKGCAELRLSGDPAVGDQEELLLRIAGEQPYAAAELEPIPLQAQASSDFLQWIAGKPSLLTQHDIMQAVRWTIAADEQAAIIRNI